MTGQPPTEQDRTVAWLQGWLPAVRLAVDDEQHARRLRDGLDQLDRWERAIAVLRRDWRAQLAELEETPPP